MSLRLDVEYPTKHMLFRSDEFTRMSRFELAVNYLLYKRCREVLRRARNALASVWHTDGPVEIYTKNLLPETARIAREGKMPPTDQALLEYFMALHFIVYTHEILHRMWHWESTSEENSSRRSRWRGRKMEEGIVTELAFWIWEHVDMVGFGVR